MKLICLDIRVRCALKGTHFIIITKRSRIY